MIYRILSKNGELAICDSLLLGVITETAQ